MRLFERRALFAAAIRCLLLAWFTCAASWAQSSSNGGIQFDVPVLAGLQRHADLLGYPAYLAVAMETNGFNPSHASRVIILGARKLEFRNLTLQFTGRKGSAFSYEAAVKWPGSSGDQNLLAIPILVDIAELPRGKIRVRLSPPLSGLIPEEIAGKIRFKAQYVADEEVQRKMLEYLDALADKTPKGGGVAGLLELVMFDAYNRGSGPAAPGARERGDAEPLSDQLYLIATLAIWFIIVPAALLLRRLWARPRARA